MVEPGKKFVHHEEPFFDMVTLREDLVSLDLATLVGLQTGNVKGEVFWR